MIIRKLFKTVKKTSPGKKIRVAMCAMETDPFVKTGGLGEVMGSLPYALKDHDVDCRFIMPFYTYIFEQKKNGFEFILNKQLVNQPMGTDKEEMFDILTLNNNGMPFYFIKKDNFFNRKHIYGNKNKDYIDNCRRFAFFSRAILTTLKETCFSPDIIHINDYHCSLLPVYLDYIRKNSEPEKEFFEKTKVVLTIHNLAFQGIYDAECLNYCGFDQDYFNIEALEYYGKVNFLKGGIMFSDSITTVSPTYSREILVPGNGFAMDGILRTREKDLKGILNGIDSKLWDPSNDEKITEKYSPEHIEGKKSCKDLVMKKNFRIGSSNGQPLIGMVSRLVEQKGIELLLKIIESLMQQDIYLIILGEGEEKYIKRLKKIRKRYKKRLSINNSYTEKSARRIFAGSDIFLMPSVFEPCGVAQLIAMKYGSVPVVRSTGGLADTVKKINNITDIKNGGTGFVFEGMDERGLLNSVRKALNFFEKKDCWKKIIANDMRTDFTWDNSADDYLSLYSELIRKPEEARVAGDAGSIEKSPSVKEKVPPEVIPAGKRTVYEKITGLAAKAVDKAVTGETSSGQMSRKMHDVKKTRRDILKKL